MYTMRAICPALTVSILLFACGSPTDADRQGDKEGVDSRADSVALVQDPATGQYSDRFLKALREQYKDATLRDSLLVLNEEETFVFPQTTVLGVPITLAANQDQLTVTVTVKRLNYTTIWYELNMTDAGGRSYSREGEADLSPHFHLGAEVDENSVSGIAYTSVEFADVQDSDCFTYIRLGREEEAGPLLGKLKMSCNGQIKDIGLNDLPTLMEIGPPIDIQALKAEPWLEVTSGVLSRKEIQLLCPDDSTYFFGFYDLIDRTKGGGPFGKLIVRLKDKQTPWKQSDVNEEFIQLTSRSNRVKVWNRVGVGDPVAKLIALSGSSSDYKAGYDKGMIEVAIGEFESTCSTVNDTIRVLNVRRKCN